MMRSETLPIYIDTYHFIEQVFRCTVKFSREYKFTIGTPLNEHVLTLGCLVVKAHRTSDRLPVLDDFLTVSEKVRLQLRLSMDFHLLSYKQYAALVQQMEQIMKQAVTWQKSERRKLRENLSESGTTQS